MLALREALGRWLPESRHDWSAFAAQLGKPPSTNAPTRRHVETGRRLERHLETLDRERALYAAVLETFESAVFLKQPDGTRKPLNSGARALLGDDGHPPPEERLRRGANMPVLELPLAGHPGYGVIVLRDSAVVLQRQLALAMAQWRLTPRQTVILGHLAEGLANKEIAAKLDCAEATVEQHLTVIYRKARAHGRTGTLALLWELAG